MRGKGTIVSEFWENETKVRCGKSGDWRIECEGCAKHFVFELNTNNLIRPSDGRRIPLSSLIRIDKS